MIKLAALAVVLALLGCAGLSDRDETRTSQESGEAGVASDDEERLPPDIRPRNIPPRPARTTCPPGMVGSC